MAKVIKFNNSSLLYDATEVAKVNSSVSSGDDVTITLDDNSDLANNDYLLIGQLGYGKAEIAQINAAVSGATDVQVDTLGFGHSAGEPITKVNYNQVEFSRATTATGEKSVLTTTDIDADNPFTTYRDTANSAGYAFFRLKNEETSVFSGYSAAYSYATADSTTKEKIKDLVKAFYEKDIDPDILDLLIDETAQEIYSMRNWKFRDDSWTFSSEADTASYTLSTAEATDLSSIVYATYDGDPVWPTFMKEYQAQNWNQSASGTPITVFLWNDTLYFTPAPADDDNDIVIWGYKNSSGLDNETSTTAMEIPSLISYKVLQDLWAPVDPNKSIQFGMRFNEKLNLMKLNDKKQVSKFRTLTETIQNNAVNDQVEFPNTITAA